jgi:hypothetical protein
MKKIDVRHLLQILFPGTPRSDSVWPFALDGADASAAPLGGAAELAH